MSINQKVKYSIAWNTLEALCYQVILFGHQVSLYKVLDAHKFGLIGMLFATIYFFASIISGGFDAAITPFFALALSSKQAFRVIIIRSFFKHCLLAGTICMGILFFSYVAQENFLLSHIPSHLLTIIGFAALSEGFHKVLKTIAQLAFKAKHVALIEVATLFCYTGLIWGAYLGGFPLSLELLLVPFLITSLLAIASYGFILFHGHRSLPENTVVLISRQELYKNQIMNFCNQLGHAFFSSNFLVPWIATHVGLAQAGTFKLISHVCYFITPILQRVFGFSSQALFAHVRDIHLVDRIKMMTAMHKKLMYVLYGITILLTLNIKTIIGINGPVTQSVPVSALILFMVLLISENLVIVYEKFCIAEQKVHYIVGYAAFSCIGLYMFTKFMPTLSIPILLLGLIGIRLCSFAIISKLVKRIQNIYLASRCNDLDEPKANTDKLLPFLHDSNNLRTINQKQILE